MTKAVRVTKRSLDVTLSLMGLALTVILFPVIALLIYLESPGPIFFRQRRAGELLGRGRRDPNEYDFREFDMFKFRTMRPNAESKTGPVLSSAKDPRVTRVGHWLRRTRLDELPQLWNVLIGDMSVIGPRPERPELMSSLAMAIPYFEERMRSLKPGITGLAQISLGYEGHPPVGSVFESISGDLTNPYHVDEAIGALADDMRMKLLCDLGYSLATETFPAYVKTEATILFRTPLVMLKGLGAHGLGR